MKILVIGDPHGDLNKIRKIPIKKPELIFLTGDIGKSDLVRKRAFENIKRKQKGLPEIKDTADYVGKAHREIHKSTVDILRYLSKYAPVYTIQGNVGIPSTSEVREDYKKYGLKLVSTRKQIDRMKNVSIVKNRLRLLQGLRVGFLEYFVDVSWVREFKPKDYQKSMDKAKKQTEKARKILNRFGEGLDILVCHQPPFGILDRVNFPGVPEHWKGKRAGSRVVLDYIHKYQPRYVFCGHIHERKGKKKIGKTQLFNVGCCGYKVIEISLI